MSIPQITYDHIDDSDEKKDVTFFLEEPGGTAEGKVLQKRHVFVTILKITTDVNSDSFCFFLSGTVFFFNLYKLLFNRQSKSSELAEAAQKSTRFCFIPV